jgi:hypothetical protein
VGSCFKPILLVNQILFSTNRDKRLKSYGGIGHIRQWCILVLPSCLWVQSAGHYSGVRRFKLFFLRRRLHLWVLLAGRHTKLPRSDFENRLSWANFETRVLLAVLQPIRRFQEQVCALVSEGRQGVELLAAWPAISAAIPNNFWPRKQPDWLCRPCAFNPTSHSLALHPNDFPLLHRCCSVLSSPTLLLL